MDLVDEQHVALVEVGEDGGQVAGPLEGRPDVIRKATPISAATMPASGGLAQAGRAGEEQVVGGLAPPAGGLQQDREVLAELGLADELVEPPGPQGDLLGRLDRVGGRDQQLVAHRRTARQLPQRRGASRSSTAPSGGRSRTASRTSSAP